MHEYTRYGNLVEKREGGGDLRFLYYFIPLFLLRMWHNPTPTQSKKPIVDATVPLAVVQSTELLCLLEVCCWTDSAECPVGQGLLEALSGSHTVRQRELGIRIGKLHSVNTLQVGRFDLAGADNLDGSRPGAVPSSHLVVQLRHGAGELDVPEFAVHVVGTATGGVPEPDAVVLDSASVLLNQLHNVNDFSSRLLHLAELVHVVPELGPGDNGARGKDDHSVGLRVGDLLGRGLAANDLESA